MKIEVFAILKDYFEKQFFITEDVRNIESLKSYLLAKNPDAEPVLNACRFAVADEFVENTYELKKDDSISIIPPGSGG